MAYELKCKGITVYRYGSKEEQVLTFDYKAEGRPEIKGNLITAESDYSGGCASRTCPF
jgi:ribonucleoside-diphosphate reductase alpha chain